MNILPVGVQCQRYGYLIVYKISMMYTKGVELKKD